MTEPMDTEARRRLDEVLDDGFVAGIGGLDDDELRQRLRVAREEEDDLSYVRRRLHGMLDILRAELEGRRSGRGTVRSIDALQEALSEDSTARAGRGARTTAAARAVSSAGRRRAERVVSETHLARLPELEPPEIESIIERVGSEERNVSGERRRVHGVIDVLEGELAARYKRGLRPPV